MPTQNQNLLDVDWSTIPSPVDDGAARHLEGRRIPDVMLSATSGEPVAIGALSGRTVVFAYPRTGQPDQLALVEEWDQIPGARGCTPQSCAFRDLHEALRTAGADHVFGLSTQDTDYQREAVERLHLPFALLSDAEGELIRAIGLPTFDVAGQTLIKRLAMVIDDGRIARVWYPVFPPDRNAGDVLEWLEENPRAVW